MSQSDPANANPYAAPVAHGQPTKPGTKNEQIRREHVTHEASIKSFGFLYLLGGVLMIIGGCVMLFVCLTGGAPADVEPSFTALLALLSGVYLVIGATQIWVAVGLRKLNQVGRIGGTIFGALGTLGFPLGTLICGYFLYLLWSEKGTMVFSPEYKDVIAATPHIKHKTSIIVWIALGLLALMFGCGIVGAIMGG